MTYEVELKFPLLDLVGFQARLQKLGAHAGPPVHQRDQYFRHPIRDFAQTDEALRIRSAGAEHRITYKGPKLDPLTKTRREIEIPLQSGANTADDLRDVWEILGFQLVQEVCKQRTPYHIHWCQRDWEILIDDVAGLGLFVEVETVAVEEDREAAKTALLELSTHLGLQSPERRSYLELILSAK